MGLQKPMTFDLSFFTQLMFSWLTYLEYYLNFHFFWLCNISGYDCTTCCLLIPVNDIWVIPTFWQIE